MANIRKAAQRVLDTARDGIGWIAFWKEGRGWNSSDFWPDYDEKAGVLTFEDYDLEEIQEILTKDPNAIIVNSYVYNLGLIEEMTRDGLANALRWHYDRQSLRLADCLN